MKTGLPEGHGLSDSIVASPILHRSGTGIVELTDVQYEALELGVAKGQSIVAIAPTSSGKTDVGLFAAASWFANGLADGARVVYLTSHRALARQKFRDLADQFAPVFSLAPNEIVLATGDDVVDVAGDPVPDALAAPLLVATYEKYLNMVAGAGMNLGTANVCCIADEIQLVGDATRGESVEILLTLLRNQVGQIVGLSAVLEERYSELLANWLHAKLLRTVRREVPLIYELRTAAATFSTSTETQRQPEQSAPLAMDTIETLKGLLKHPGQNEPVAVFCMTKKQVFQLSAAWAAEAARLGAKVDNDLPFFREPTSSSEELERYLPHRFAYHTADLNEDERVAVETRLDGSALRVVFATTTLAAGLNYSFRTVIIHAWERWNFAERRWIPILRGDFHNMAGRAGRLSHVDTPGRVIFFAQEPQQIRAAPRYLSWWELDETHARIHPAAFPQLSLQLLAAGVADSNVSLFEFLQSTFSAERELERNIGQPDLWRDAVEKAVANLKKWKFVS